MKIELKPGLYLEGDYAYISDPRIASCFINKYIELKSDKELTAFTDIGYYWSYPRGFDKTKYSTLYPLKIHKSIFKSEVEPVEGFNFIWTKWTIFAPEYKFMKKNHIELFKKDMIEYGRKILRASEITLNLNIEKLNQLWEWLYGEGK